MDYNLPEEVAVHFETPYRIGRVNGKILKEIHDADEKRVQGARIFRDIVLDGRSSRTFRSLKAMALELKKAGIVRSEAYGEEIIPELDGGKINYSDGNSVFGHLEFLTEAMSNGRRNGTERTRKVYRIVDHPQELYGFKASALPRVT